jgi:hypothetical protein
MIRAGVRHQASGIRHQASLPPSPALPNFNPTATRPTTLTSSASTDCSGSRCDLRDDETHLKSSMRAPGLAPRPDDVDMCQSIRRLAPPCTSEILAPSGLCRLSRRPCNCSPACRIGWRPRTKDRRCRIRIRLCFCQTQCAVLSYH